MQWHPSFGFREAGMDLRDPALYLAGAEGAPTLPALAYHSKTFQDLEDEALWTRSWIPVGVVSRIANPGDVLPYTVGFHGTHVQRLSDGRLRAAFNLAQHGGCRSVPEQCRTGHRTRCSYTSCGHSRDRDVLPADELEGSAREAGQYLGFNPDKLTPIALTCWGPVAFVHLDPHPTPLHEQLSGLPPALASLDRFDRHVLHRQVEVACNWKVAACRMLDGDVDSCQSDPAGAAAGSRERSWWRSPVAESAGDGSAPRWAVAVMFPNLIVAVCGDWLCTVNLQPTGPASHLQRWDVSHAGHTLRDDEPMPDFQALIPLAGAPLVATQRTVESGTGSGWHSPWTGNARSFEALIASRLMTIHTYPTMPQIYMNPVQSAR